MRRLGFENARISTIHVKTRGVGRVRSNKTFREMDCQARRKWGTVSYDLNKKQLGSNTW